MRINKELHIKDVFIIESKKHHDNRGWFQESYHMDNMSKHEFDLVFVQDNLVFSKKHVLRGLHFQDDNGQGKLVSCVKGSIYDVLVDLRKNSNTYREWMGIKLSEKDSKFIYIPPGFAHGYYVIEQDSLVNYKCTKHYNPNEEIGIVWNDSDIQINWRDIDGFNSSNVVMSEKDQLNKTIKELNL